MADRIERPTGPRDAARDGGVIPAFVNDNADDADEASRVLTEAGGFDVVRIAPASLAQRVRDVVRAGAKRLLVAGGDGTIGTTADVLVRSGVELAILPAGTLNHLAKDLGLPEQLPEALATARGAATSPIDVGMVNGRVFLNTSSVGAYVTFVRVRERWRPRLGYWLASAIAAVHILARVPRFLVALEVDGVTREYLTPLVFVGVSERELRLPTLGARVDGGRRGLHVMVVRSGTGARILALALAAATRGIHAVARTPAMDAFLVDSCRIVPRRGMRIGAIAVDGEIITTEPPLEYQIVRDGLTVVVG